MVEDIKRKLAKAVAEKYADGVNIVRSKEMTLKKLNKLH